MATTAVLAATTAAARSADFTVTTTAGVYITPGSVAVDVSQPVAVLQRKSTLDPSGYQDVYRVQLGIEIKVQLGGKNPHDIGIIMPGVYSVFKNATVGAVGVSVDS